MLYYQCQFDFIINYIQEVETTPAYPDICFAVDDFDSTFDAVVMFVMNLITSLFVCLFFFLLNKYASNWLLELSFHDLCISIC